jgi:hypothetical protein
MATIGTIVQIICATYVPTVTHSYRHVVVPIEAVFSKQAKDSMFCYPATAAAIFI